MIIVLKPGTQKEQYEHILDRVKEYGFKPHPIVGEERTVIACVGDELDPGGVRKASPRRACPDGGKDTRCTGACQHEPFTDGSLFLFAFHQRSHTVL